VKLNEIIRMSAEIVTKETSVEELAVNIVGYEVER